jgi:putative sensory transduction regulator
MASVDGTGAGPHLTPAQLDTFFIRYGWDYEHPPETEGVWQTGFSEERAAFDIFVQLTEEWVIFMVYPFTLRPEGAARARVAERLATLNYELTMVKAGLDDEGDTFLGVELSTEDFAFSHFRNALDQLTEAAVTHHMDLELLATGG